MNLTLWFVSLAVPLLLLKVPRRFQPWGLPLLLFLLPFERIGSYELFVGTSEITVRPTQLLGAALILASLRSLAASWRRSPSLWPLAYFGAGLLSLTQSLSLERSLLVFAFSIFVWLLYLAVRELGRGADLTRLELGLRLALIATGAFGFYQFLGDMLGLPPALTGLREAYTKQAFGFPRIQAFGLEPLYLASFLLIPLGIYASYFVRVGGRRNALLLLLTSFLLILTLSRGGYAGGLLALALVGVLAWPRARRRVAMVATAAAGALLAIMLIQVSTEFFKERPTATPHTGAGAVVSQATNTETKAGVTTDREIYREMAWQAFEEHPLTGVGIGNFGHWLHAEDPTQYTGTRTIVNNEPLELLAETGVVGFGAMLAFLLVILRRSWRAIRSGLGGADERAWLIGLTAATTGFAVQYQTFSTLYITHIWVALGLLVAVQDRILEAPKRRARKAAAS